MNSAVPKQDPGLDFGETTLRLIAKLPAPEGLVDRVQSSLRTAPPAARILPWKRPLWLQSNVVRSAAAAAIVCVVAGGGWRIYTRVQPPTSAKVLQMPAPAQPSTPFSTGNAMRVPQSLDRPVLSHPPAVSPDADTAQTTPTSHSKAGGRTRKKKAAGKVTAIPVR